MEFDTIVIGAGAAGMMCAAHCTGRVLVIDHARAAGEKIRISGGGRCNFTNMNTSPAAFLSQNPHFCKSALSRYTQWDFLDLVNQHQIAWHEKTLGQLFCDTSAKEIVAMLLAQMRQAGAELWLQTSVRDLSYSNGRFQLAAERDGKITALSARALVLATGGKSIPKMGASGFSYEAAQKFGLKLTETRPALVPLTFSDKRFAPISGVSLPVRTNAGGGSFDEAALFTHRGLSGPAILQISSYWREGEEISLDLDPEAELLDHLRSARQTQGKRALTTILAQHFPARLVDHLQVYLGTDLPLTERIGDQGDAALARLVERLRAWHLKPTGSEGYRTAEVTLGGVDTDGVSSKTFEAKTQPGLYLIGEVLDVTGWLGGYNFQWAWSSGWAAGQAIAQARSQ